MKKHPVFFAGSNFAATYMNQNCCRKLIMLLAFFSATQAFAQKILLISSQNELYSFEMSNGSCITTTISIPCTIQNDKLFSIALYKDTLYFNTGAGTGSLYQSVLGKPNSCKLLTAGVGSNALTVDRNGMLYWMDGANLITYDPRNNVVLSTKRIPYGSAGDLVFYKEKLYLGSPSGLVEINMDEPSKSKVVMPVQNFLFFGLISIPSGCDKNTVYGLDVFANTSSVVELDIDNGKIVKPVCSLPFIVWDAASITESGVVPGITVSGVDAKTVCGPGELGAVQVKAFSAVKDVTLTYTLDGSTTSADGKFTGVAAGSHKVTIKSSDDCTAEVAFTIGVAEKISISAVVTPDNCGSGNGTLTLQKNSGGSFMYTLDNGPEQVSNVFSGLAAGNHALRVRDENNCSFDTVIAIQHVNPPLPLSSLVIKPSSCRQNDGQIDISFSSSGIQGVKLGNGSFQLQNSFTNVAAGTYTLQIRTATCLYDTVLVVPFAAGIPPSISYTNKSPDCFASANGSTTIHLSGAASPFMISFNGAAYTSVNQFTGLAAGVYPLSIRDANGCTWPAFDTIPAYTVISPLIQPSILHAECITSQPGKVSLVISGPASPYVFEIGQQRLRSGNGATLFPGSYKARIFTAANCLVDSVMVTVLLQNSSGGTCDTVYVPSAFTPNGDGKNDILQPFGSKLNTQWLLFRVFNRWGQLVYESREFGKGWDGRIKGQPQPTETYVWVVEYINSIGETRVHRGTSVLLR
jgi:gliding motility-associated-like protein